MKKILVTGGAGFIGSHTCVELLNQGYDLVVLDNLCNASKKSLAVVEALTGKKVTFYQTDIRDTAALEAIFKKEDIAAVIHFAGLKTVSESAQLPLLYYDNNVNGTLRLLEVMAKYGCKNLIFSSSATVYGDQKVVPITEEASLFVNNPYGRTKLMLEDMLRDLHASDPSWNIVILRYFNPIGAHESGLLGEDPKGIPNNLMPYIMKVAAGELPCLGVFGDDYDTPDGTGVRDYIHVVDLAKGHVLAIEKYNKPGLHICNLGTGQGYSVLELVHAFERVNGVKVKYEIKPRRAGDIATCYADPTRAKEQLGWVAEKNLDDMCRDTWNFAKQFIK